MVKIPTGKPGGLDSGVDCLGRHPFAFNGPGFLCWIYWQIHNAIWFLTYPPSQDLGKIMRKQDYDRRLGYISGDTKNL